MVYPSFIKISPSLNDDLVEPDANTLKMNESAISKKGCSLKNEFISDNFF